MRRGIYVELFDLHCDTLGKGLHHEVDIAVQDGAVDLRRGAVYMPWYQVFAAWIPDGMTVTDARRECAALLDVADRWEKAYGFYTVNSTNDLFRQEDGCHSILAVENGGALRPDATYLHWLCRRGVKMITLTWNGDNDWGSGCFGSERGLMPDGKWAISALEECGIVVDVAHLNGIGFQQVSLLAKRPFVVSHTACAAVHPHPRNLTDEQFCAVRERGGLVGLSLYPEHLGDESMECIRRHLEHFLSLGGERTLCFGADFDGMTAPMSWDGISVMKRIMQYLKKTGWSSELLRAVFYTNARDFFAQYWTQNTRNEE